MGKVGVAASPARAGRVWVIVEAEGDEGGLYRSDNGGDTWEQVSSERVLHTPRLVLHTRVRRSRRREHRVRHECPVLEVRRRRQDFLSRLSAPHGDQHYLWINPDEPRWMINANDGGANVSFDGARELVAAGQPADGTVLPRDD